MLRPIIIPALATLIHSGLSLSFVGRCLSLDPIPGITSLTLWGWLGAAFWIHLYSRLAQLPSTPR